VNENDQSRGVAALR